MAWILLLLAIACFVATFFTTSIALGALCLVLALVLMVAAMMMLLSVRVDNATRSAPMLSPEELRVLREQAERQRNAVAASDAIDHPNTSNEIGTPPPPQA